MLGWQKDWGRTLQLLKKILYVDGILLSGTCALWSVGSRYMYSRLRATKLLTQEPSGQRGGGGQELVLAGCVKERGQVSDEDEEEQHLEILSASRVWYSVWESHFQ